MIIENEKYVDAAPSKVWQLTQDIESWPRWTPTVTDVERLGDEPFGVGSVARVKQPGLPPTGWRVTAFTAGAGFTWEARVRGMRMIATHALTPSGSGTRSLLRLEVSGLPALVLGPWVRASLRKALEQENAGLKAASEALAAPGASVT